MSSCSSARNASTEREGLSSSLARLRSLNKSAMRKEGAEVVETPRFMTERWAEKREREKSGEKREKRGAGEDPDGKEGEERGEEEGR